MSNFIPLHCHTTYSVLDGLTKVDEMFEKASKLQMPAVAITDHGSLSSLPEALKCQEKYGVKFMPGVEFYVVDEKNKDIKKQRRYHLIVIAKNWDGVVSINEQLTLANKHFNRKPVLDFDDILNFNECIISTACSGGILSHPEYKFIVEDLHQAYKDDFYLELMFFEVYYGEESGEKAEIDQQKLINERALELAEKHGIKYIVTNDSHFLNRDDYDTHCVMLAIQRNTTMDNPKRWQFDTDEVYFKSDVEIYKAGLDLGYLDKLTIVTAMKETLNIAEKVNVQYPEFKFDMPSPFDEPDKDVFNRLVMDGFKRKVVGKVEDIEKYKDRLFYEIGVIEKLDLIRYFLINHDIIKWAKDQRIMVGPARGSASASIVAYLMDITEVDPIEHDLIFERFLNPDRKSMADIDTDFEDSRRHEVFEYMRQKYGEESTAQITTFGVIHAKTAFRDVARAYGISNYIINDISTQMPDAIEGKKLEECIEEVYALKDFYKKNPTLLTHSLKLEGVIKSVGVHAAGMIVHNGNLTDRCVVECRKSSGDKKDSYVVNWDKDISEDNGLLKMDILGLSALSILSHCVDLIVDNHHIGIDLNSLPLDNENAINILKDGDTVGVFQFESQGLRQLLRDIKCDTFKKAYHTTALYRPGSLESGETQKYIDVVSGREQAFYEHPVLEEILHDTYGAFVFQEQLMAIFHKLAGFTMGESDTMRKIIGKKLGKGEFEKHRDHFVTGCKEVSNFPEQSANALFDKMVSSASYSFNLGHSVAYTMISYQMAYLKANYPLEFYTAILSSEKKEKMKVYIRDAKRHGVEIVMPDINMSQKKYSIHDGKIVAPFTAIKGVGAKAVDEILKARGRGIFQNFDDFKERVYKRVVNKRVQQTLIDAGCFQGKINDNPDERIKKMLDLVQIYEELPDIRKNTNSINETKMFELYSQFKEGVVVPNFSSKKPSIFLLTNLGLGDKINLEKGGKGLMNSKNTKIVYDYLKEYGFKHGDLYATCTIKNKDCAKDLLHMDQMKGVIAEEVEIVRPSVIWCTSGAHIDMFLDEKMKMADVEGQVFWSKKYQVPVVFSYSVQYYAFKDEYDKIREVFELLGDIFS